MGNRNLNPRQFRIEHDEEVSADNISSHGIYAYHPDFAGGRDPVGSMFWSGNTGEISMVSVNKEYQRQGIATRLYHEAPNYGPIPRHSNAQSPEGAQWAKKVGGPSVNDRPFKRSYLGDDE